MCFRFYLLADGLFYRLWKAGFFPKFGVTLIFSITASYITRKFLGKSVLVLT